MDGEPRRRDEPGGQSESVAGSPAWSAAPAPGAKQRVTLNEAVRRRRADRAFYIRLAGAIRQNDRALERLKR